jgi:hypothetical protein
MTVLTQSATMQRITLVTDETLEQMIVEQALRLGVSSYICCYCSGKPLHQAVEKPVSRCSLVRIEFLAQPTEAEAVMDYLQHLRSRNYGLTAVMDTVTTCP